MVIDPKACKPGEAYEGTVGGKRLKLLRRDDEVTYPWVSTDRIYFHEDVSDLVRLVPASREDAALAERLERQSETIGKLQGVIQGLRRAHEIVEQERDQARERAKAAEARTAVTREEVTRAVRRGHTMCNAESGVVAEICALLGIEAGQPVDPAVFVVRESDVAAVKVTEAGRYWRAGDTSSPLTWKANKVREKRDECAVEWAELEAVARAIEAEEAVGPDPVEAKAIELWRTAYPDSQREGSAFGDVRDAYRRMARHVIGQEVGDE